MLSLVLLEPFFIFLRVSLALKRDGQAVVHDYQEIYSGRIHVVIVPAPLEGRYPLPFHKLMKN